MLNLPLKNVPYLHAAETAKTIDSRSTVKMFFFCMFGQVRNIFVENYCYFYFNMQHSSNRRSITKKIWFINTNEFQKKKKKSRHNYIGSSKTKLHTEHVHKRQCKYPFYNPKHCYSFFRLTIKCLKNRFVYIQIDYWTNPNDNCSRSKAHA